MKIKIVNCKKSFELKVKTDLGSVQTYRSKEITVFRPISDI